MQWSALKRAIKTYESLDKISQESGYNLQIRQLYGSSSDSILLSDLTSRMVLLSDSKFMNVLHFAMLIILLQDKSLWISGKKRAVVTNSYTLYDISLAKNINLELESDLPKLPDEAFEFEQIAYKSIYYLAKLLYQDKPVVLWDMVARRINQYHPDFLGNSSYEEYFQHHADKVQIIRIVQLAIMNKCCNFYKNQQILEYF